MYIAVDAGSTHMGKIALINELIRVAKGCGADAIKWQLGNLKPPNVPLPVKLWRGIEEECARVGIQTYASIWDKESFDWYVKASKAKRIKFAYSQNRDYMKMERARREAKMEVVVSCDPMTDRHLSHWCTKLFCIPLYPLVYKPNFDGIFPRFDGFSCHAIGNEIPLDALRYGAKELEVHLTLDRPEIFCPDAFFAYTPKQLESLVYALRSFGLPNKKGKRDLSDPQMGEL